jgi:hypothetical protein
MQRNTNSGLVLGVLLLFSMHFLAFTLYFPLLYLATAINNVLPTPIGNFFLTEYRFLIPLLIPGISQLVYVIPLALWLRKKRRFELMKGVLIGAVMTALLNGGCFLFLRIVQT